MSEPSTKNVAGASVKRVVSLVWRYSRNQLRHTASDQTGEDLFYIKSERPQCEIRKRWHGFNLYTAAGVYIQHAKHVDVLKRAAQLEANAPSSPSAEPKKI